MICETCKHKCKADDEWPCKYCAPDDRRYEKDDGMAKQPQEVVDLAQKLLKSAGKQSPITLMKALLLCMQLVDATTHGPRKVGSGDTAPAPPEQAHYPEEWGPSDNRRLTCVCGDPDPFHATKTHNAIAQGREPGLSGEASPRAMGSARENQ